MRQPVLKMRSIDIVFKHEISPRSGLINFRERFFYKDSTAKAAFILYTWKSRGQVQLTDILNRGKKKATNARINGSCTRG